MSRKYKYQKSVDISGYKLTHHAWERFIRHSGIAEIIEAEKMLNLILQKAQRYKRSKKSIIYKNGNWRIVVKMTTKRPTIVTIHKIKK